MDEFAHNGEAGSVLDCQLQRSFEVAISAISVAGSDSIPSLLSNYRSSVAICMALPIIKSANQFGASALCK